MFHPCRTVPAGVHISNALRSRHHESTAAAIPARARDDPQPYIGRQRGRAWPGMQGDDWVSKNHPAGARWRREPGPLWPPGPFAPALPTCVPGSRVSGYPGSLDLRQAPKPGTLQPTQAIPARARGKALRDRSRARPRLAGNARGRLGAKELSDRSTLAQRAGPRGTWAVALLPFPLAFPEAASAAIRDRLAWDRRLTRHPATDPSDPGLRPYALK